MITHEDIIAMDDTRVDISLSTERVAQLRSMTPMDMRQDGGNIKRREDGKVMKNPNTPKVKLWDLVK
jgi:hypothetical protein